MHWLPSSFDFMHPAGSGLFRPRGRRRSKRISAALLVVISLALTIPASAQESTDPTQLADEGLVRLSSVQGGALLFETGEPGWYVPAPALNTTVDVAVSGPIARTTVSQRFHNIADVFVHGKYVFPLPEGAAVDSLRMQVGDRWIQGRIEGREEAVAIFEEAKAAGQVASLVEQERPNVFTTSVANIAPQVDVVVQIEYQESLAPRDGVFGLRIPMVVAPRYTPEDQLIDELVLGPEGWAEQTTLAGGASRVSPPVADPAADEAAGARNPVEISIDLDAGFPLGEIDSAYHDVDIDQQDERSARVELAGPVPADRDFYLSWQPKALADPYAAAFTGQHGDDTHFITMVTPPAADQVGKKRRQREVIFVQDTSGSMSGNSLVQAKAGLRRALKRLDENDVFNIIEFNSNFTTLADEPLAATPLNIERGIGFINRLAADGGTEMLPALRTALADNDTDDGRLRQVIFLTDGAVSNELQMLDLIERDLAGSRLFTVGIGSAPNSYFMTAAARAGRGSFVFIGDLNEVDARMQALFEKIETPAVVDLAVEGFDGDVSISPSPIPDLYAGDPVVLAVRLPDGATADSIRVTGNRDGAPWHLDIDLANALERPGVSKLWAREHIRDLEALRSSPEVDQEDRLEIDETILETALDFELVSRLTALVAVDLEVTRPDGAESTATEVPTNLPAGWDPRFFFSAADARQVDPSDFGLSDDAVARLGLAEEGGAVAAGQPGVPLPATGADWQVRAILGSLMVIAGVAGIRRSTDRKGPT